MTDRPTEWVDFKEEDWQRIVEMRSLFSCLRITTDVDKEKWSIYPSFTFPVKEDDGFVTAGDNLSASVKTYSSYDKTVNSYHESGYDVTSANIGVPGIAKGSVTTRDEHSSSETFAETEVYATSTYKVPKVRIALIQDKIKLQEDFVKEIKDALTTGRDNNFKNMNLVNVLNKYGHYVVTQFELGGLLRGSSSKVVTSHRQAEEFSQSVQVSFEADLSALDVPISGGASYEHGSSQGSESEQEHEKVKLSIEALGGDPSKFEKFSPWAASLKPYDDWRIIQTGGLVPVINFLDTDLLNQVATVISRVEGYSDYVSKANQAPILDD